MNRAWSTFEIKASSDDAERTFEGIASTPTLDRGDDSMDPLGAEFTLPLPLLWQHGKGSIKDPVGWVTHATPGKDGIYVKGKFAQLDSPPSLKDDLDRAWALVKSRLVRGLSIGWQPIKGEPIKGGGVRWSRWGWHELSPVTIAMNEEASITRIKTLDQAQMRAASGTARAVSLTSGTPGVSGLAKPASRGFVKLIPRNPK